MNFNLSNDLDDDDFIDILNTTTHSQPSISRNTINNYFESQSLEDDDNEELKANFNKSRKNGINIRRDKKDVSRTLDRRDKSISESSRSFDSQYLESNFQDIYNISPDDIFLDENGLPTDTFLESLKNDVVIHPDVLNIANDMINNDKQRNQKSHHYYKNTVEGNFNRGDESNYRKHHKNGHRHGLTQIDRDDDSVERKQHNKRKHQTNDDVARSTGGSTRNPASSSNISARKSNSANDHIADSHTEKSDNHKATSKGSSIGVQTNDFVVERARSINHQTTQTSQTESRAQVDTIPAESTPENRTSSAYESLTRDDLYQPYHDEPKLDAENESKIRSLNLRIKGQIQTIRNLEAKQQESLAVIEIRNKQLDQLQLKYQTLEKKLAMNNAIKYSEYSAPIPSNHVKHAESIASKYKTQYETLTKKLVEEQARRQRSDERLKIVREYIEQTKIQVTETEKKNQELENRLEDAHKKITRLKKDSKEQVNLIESLRTKITNYEQELANYKSNADRSAANLTKIQSAMERQQKDYQLCQLELKASIDRYRHAQIEIEILKEKLQIQKHNNETLSHKPSYMNSRNEFQSTSNTTRLSSANPRDSEEISLPSRKSEKKMNLPMSFLSKSVEVDRSNKQQLSSSAVDPRRSYQNDTKLSASINQTQTRPIHSRTTSILPSKEPKPVNLAEQSKSWHSSSSQYDRSTEDDYSQSSSAKKSKIRSRSLSPVDYRLTQRNKASIMNTNNNSHEKLNQSGTIDSKGKDSITNIGSNVTSDGNKDNDLDDSRRVDENRRNDSDSSRSNRQSTNGTSLKDKYLKLKEIYDRVHGRKRDENS